MKKLFVFLLCFFLSYNLMAKDKVKQKELGLAFGSLNSFGLTYKIGTNKALWRFNTLFISGGNSDYSNDSSSNIQKNIGFGIRFGREYRKLIVENIELRFGVDLSFSYSESKLEVDDKTVNDYDRLSSERVYSPGLNLVFGLNYVIKNNLVIGAELLPYFYYNSGSDTDKYKNIYNNNEYKRDISGSSYGISNSSALLTLVVRF